MATNGTVGPQIEQDSSKPFFPKQHIPLTPEVLCELCNPATCNVASFFLKDIAKSPSPSSWVVHDNACGYGEVTRALLDVASTLPANSIEIVGTDVSPAMVKAFNTKLENHSALEKGNIKISAEAQDAASLKFPDEHFTHSFTNFLVNSGPLLDKNAQILGEIHRTLRSDGIAVITNWNRIGFADAIQNVHKATREEDSPQLLMGMGKEILKPEFLVSIVEDAGFERSKMTVLSHEVMALAPWADSKAKARYLAVMWSVLGATTSGWSPADEQRWQAALEALGKELSASDDLRVNESGQLEMPLVSTIVIARK